MLAASSLPMLLPVAANDRAFYEQLGLRIATLRKARGLTQVQLAEQLGVAQQTLAHYEGGVSRIAVALLPVLAEVLDCSIETLVADDAKASKRAGKRGPAPKIQQQLEQVAALPKAKQKLVSEVIESVLAQNRR